MNLLKRFVARIALLWNRARFRSELDEDMAFHRAEAEREHIAAGMSPDEAHYAAIRQFGNAAKLKGQSEEVVGFRAESTVQDIGFALRQLRRNPGFALTAMLILALGIASSVTIFGFVDAALIQPLPFAKPDRLIDVSEKNATAAHTELSRPDYEDWKRMNTTLDSLDVWTFGSYLLHTSETTERIAATRVSVGFLRTLGVKPMLGRDFLPGEDRPGGPRVAILQYSMWQQRFGGRADIIGQSINLSGTSYTVVGVMPKEFAFAPRGNGELWVPSLDDDDCGQRRDCRDFFGVGRLRDGVSTAAAHADLQRIAAQLEAQYPESNRGQGAAVRPIEEIIIGDFRPILLTVLSGAGLLLLIASVNVASLVLVRTEGRRREIAVRGALGATRTRIVRQFMTEGLLLACSGCAVGLAVASRAMRLLAQQVPPQPAGGMPFLQTAKLNTHTILFAACITVLAAFLLSVVPALRLAGTDIRDALSEGGRTAAGRFWQRLGAHLVVVELTVTVVLLTGAGLLGRSFYKLLHVELGFSTAHLVTLHLQASGDKYKTAEQSAALYRAIDRRLSALPGVESVSLTSGLPAECNCPQQRIRIADKPFHGERISINEREVTHNYFATLQARLLRGRLLTQQDDTLRPQPIVVNESLVKKYFPGEDPIGKKIGDENLTPDSLRQIVGVVADIREGSLQEELWPTEYRSIDPTNNTFFAMVVRTAHDDKSLPAALMRALKQVDSEFGVYRVQTMQQHIDATGTALLHRSAAWLVGGFAVIAFLLSVIGLYGVVSYSVSQRTREIGVRMALGAQRSAVYAMVMRQAIWLTAVGVGCGLILSFGTSAFVRKLLFGVQAWDVSTLFGVAAVLVVAALLASFLPARRAASVNPTEALRAE